jgi:hypothetical protein
MGPSPDPSEGRTFAARFDGGTRHGTMALVRGLESGQPPDVVRDPSRPDGVYLLAGGPRADGCLPYWWITWTRLASLRSLGHSRHADRIANTS